MKDCWDCTHLEKRVGGFQYCLLHGGRRNVDANNDRCANYKLIDNITTSKMTKKETVSAKLVLFAKISKAIHDCYNRIMAGKQPIPWASTRVGPVYAVTTDNIGHNIGQILHNEIRDLLREIDICTKEESVEKQTQNEPVAWMYEGEPDFDGKKWNTSYEVTTDFKLATYMASPKEPIPLYTELS
jgi:hypothetical protein